MKASDIVNKLALFLPKVSDKFTSNISLSSLTRSGTTVTGDTGIAAHGLSAGQQVNILGAKTPLVVSSLTRSGTTGTLVTSSNHDMTEKFSKTVELSGSTESEFNGTFTVLKVPNRKTVTFTMPNSGAMIATGAPLLLNGSSELQQYNGLYNVATVPTTTTFTYEIVDTTLYSPAAGTISARTNPRVSSSLSIEHVVAAYTKQLINDLWAFVVLDSVTASKNRDINSDATDNLQTGNHYRQQIIQPFTVYVVIPSVADIAGSIARDLSEDLFKPLCQSLLLVKLDSGLTVGMKNPINFVEHGSAFYNSAVYVHGYTFQSVADITFEDTIGYDVDVAFRDVTTSMLLELGTKKDPVTADIDLDEVDI